MDVAIYPVPIYSKKSSDNLSLLLESDLCKE